MSGDRDRRTSSRGRESLFEIAEAAVAGKRTLVGSDASARDAGTHTLRAYDVYVDIHRRDLIDAVAERLSDSAWPDPAPDLPFAEGGDRWFTNDLVTRMRSAIAARDGRALSPLLAPGDPIAAWRTYVPDLKHASWSAQFGLAFADLAKRAVWASLTKRIGPRYRAALAQMYRRPTAEELISGHPIDPIIAHAIAEPGVLDITNVTAEKNLGAPTLKKVTTHWLGGESRELWNFVRVTPASATAEEVAATLWGSPDHSVHAHALVKLGDVFRVEPGLARQLLHERFPKEVIGSSDSSTSKAKQILAFARSNEGVRARDRATRRDRTESSSDAEKSEGASATSPRVSSKEPDGEASPTIQAIMAVERRIGVELDRLRDSVRAFGLAERLRPAYEQRSERVAELAEGAPDVLARYAPALQFQHAQLLAINARTPVVIEQLRPLAFLPEVYLDRGKRDHRAKLRDRLGKYVDAASISHDRAASSVLLGAVETEQRAEYLDGLRAVQGDMREAMGQAVQTREGSVRGSLAADEELTRQQEAALAGKAGGRSAYEQKRATIRAGEIALRSRMRAVDQSLAQLRDAADAAGFADGALLRKFVPGVKSVPETIADVRDHLREVDRVWDRTRGEFTPDVQASDAPDDWAEWQEREAGVTAAREAFAKIAGDQDIGTFLRECSKKIRHQQMINAITTVASALLISLAAGAGAAMLGRLAATTLAGEGAGLAAKLLAAGVDVGINVSINSVVQLAQSPGQESTGWVLLENLLMEVFTRSLMKPIAAAERTALREAEQIANLPGLSQLERATVLRSADFAGVHLITEGLGSVVTGWAAHRIVTIARETGTEATESFASTVVQQAAAIGLGKFFARRAAVWKKHWDQLQATRFGKLPAARALSSARDAFYDEAHQLASDLSPPPDAGPALQARDAELLRQERLLLSEHSALPREASGDSASGAVTDADTPAAPLRAEPQAQRSRPANAEGGHRSSDVVVSEPPVVEAAHPPVGELPPGARLSSYPFCS